jgi:hypothetical protein
LAHALQRTSQTPFPLQTRQHDTIKMTHRRILEFAGLLAEHGATVAGQCRGIPVAALRAYLKLRQHQCQTWLETLAQKPPTSHYDLRIPCSASLWYEVQPILEEIATSGVLLRVSSTVLHAIGQRWDIPLAIDVARQTARAYDSVVQRAIAFVTVDEDLPNAELAALDRLGRLADRLSDVFCGALLPVLQCDRFVVDRDRAKDFAETFGRQPSLVRVAVQNAVQCVPDRVQTVGLVEEVERAVAACLPIIASLPAAQPLKGQNLAHTKGFRVICPNAGSDGAKVEPQQTCSSTFPTLSFAQARRRLRAPNRE